MENELRDLFAAVAVVGLLSEPQWEDQERSHIDSLAGDKSVRYVSRIAIAAYKIADAMIEERKKGKQS